MGRDISVVSTHPASANASVRAIISAENSVDMAAGVVKFDLKPSKVHVFDRNSEEKL